MVEHYEYKGHQMKVTDFGVLVDGMEFATEEEAMDWIDFIEADDTPNTVPSAPVEVEYAVTYVPRGGRSSNTMYMMASNPDEAVQRVLNIIPRGSYIVDVN